MTTRSGLDQRLMSQCTLRQHPLPEGALDSTRVCWLPTGEVKEAQKKNLVFKLEGTDDFWYEVVSISPNTMPAYLLNTKWDPDWHDKMGNRP